MGATRSVRHRGPLAELDDGLRDEAPVPGVARGPDLRSRSATPLGLVQDALVGVRQSRATDRSGHGGGAGSQTSAEVGQSARNNAHRRDARREARRDGETRARVADRVLEHVAKRLVPTARGAWEPRAERARDRRGQQTRPGHEVEAELAEVLGRRRGRRRPWPQTTIDLVALRRDRMIGRSPPGPFRCGSTTWSTKPAAAAASKALPPASSSFIPAAEASQCVEATIPKVPCELRPSREHGRTVERKKERRR